jgi:hypothetical protein
MWAYDVVQDQTHDGRKFRLRLVLWTSLLGKP